MLLVLVVDVSRSVTEPKFGLQREGTAAALSHPDDVKTITAGPNRRIAVCLLEWAAAGMWALTKKLIQKIAGLPGRQSVAARVNCRFALPSQGGREFRFPRRNLLSSK